MFPRLWSAAEVAADGPQRWTGHYPERERGASLGATLARKHSYNAHGGQNYPRCSWSRFAA